MVAKSKPNSKIRIMVIFFLPYHCVQNFPTTKRSEKGEKQKREREENEPTEEEMSV